jgi:pimeloyl-ACP methyl ester carboxylesterase
MSRLIETRRGPVECAVSGEGPALLALHGAMGGYDQGVLLLRTVVGSAGFRFVSVSRPGYLGTPLASGRTPEEQADLCAEVLDELRIGEAVVIAVSGGGQCALQFGLRHGDRCRGLVMVSACSAPLNARLPIQFQLLKLMARLPALAAAMQKRGARDPDRFVSRSIPDAGLRARTLQDPEAGPLLLALEASTLERLRLRLPGTQNDVAQSRLPFAYPLERIAAPMLVVHGTADRVVPFAQAASLAGRAPGAELLAIENGEHVAIFTHRDEVRSRVTGFLSTLRLSEVKVVGLKGELRS